MSENYHSVPVLIQGQEYRVSPLSVGARTKLAQYIREEPVRQAMRMIREYNIQGPEASEIMKTAYASMRQDKRITTKVLEQDAQGDNVNEEYGLRMLYLCLLPNHPQLSFEAVMGFPLAEAETAMEALATANGEDVDALKAQALANANSSAS